MTFIRSRGFRILLGLTFVTALAAGAGALYLYFDLTRDLPDLERLDDYRPAVVSEVFDRRGRLIGEFSTERRRIVPVDAIPDHVKLAFVAAEDKSFFTHPGIDLQGIARAAWANLRAGGEIKQGASTITQQMVKSLLLSPERTYRRKMREVILAIRIEESLSKDEILYLYLNQIYFGHGAWGIGEAARSYFGKNVEDLTVSEAALLAGLPQRPSDYSPYRNPELAERRRLYVLGRMLEDGVIDAPTHEDALVSPPVLAPPENAEAFSVASYFTEQVRRQLFDEFGGDLVLKGGLRIETTLDLDLQTAAVGSLRAGLRAQDKRAGYRGPLRQVEASEYEAEIERLAVENELLPPEPELEELAAVPGAVEGEEGSEQLAAGSEAVEGAEPAALAPEGALAGDTAGASATEEGLADATADSEDGDALEVELLALEIPTDRPVVGLVVAVDPRDQSAEVAFAPGRLGRVYLEDVDWAREPNLKRRPRPVKKITSILRVGDVAGFERLSQTARELEPVEDDAEAPPPPMGIFQEPESQAALLSIEVGTGHVIAMVGGYDYEKSQYNRATQALRQPGSAFKPLIYGAALSEGYTPVSTLYDRPIVYEDPVTGFKYKPQNYERRFFGPVPMRYALAHSINNATVHLFRDVGVDYVIDYARRLGIHSPLQRDLSLAIGSSSVTLNELTTAYAVFPNHGRRVVPRFVTRVTDPDGNVLLENLPLDGPAAAEEEPLPAVATNGEAEPLVEPALYEEGDELEGEQLISEADAYLMCDLMKAVVNEGTGRRVKRLGGYLAGKTGTTNEFVDAWYMGFSSELTTGVWVGHDQRQSLGQSESGARAALPIWKGFMEVALKQYPVRDFEAPPGIEFRSIDRLTGLLADANTKDAYFQPFVEGTAPTETSSQVSSASDTHSAVRDDLF